MTAMTRFAEHRARTGRPTCTRANHRPVIEHGQPITAPPAAAAPAPPPPAAAAVPRGTDARGARSPGWSPAATPAPLRPRRPLGSRRRPSRPAHDARRRRPGPRRVELAPAPLRPRRHPLDRQPPRPRHPRPRDAGHGAADAHAVPSGHGSAAHGTGHDADSEEPLGPVDVGMWGAGLRRLRRRHPRCGVLRPRHLGRRRLLTRRPGLASGQPNVRRARRCSRRRRCRSTRRPASRAVRASSASHRGAA